MNAKKPKWRLATMKRTVQGKFTRWRKGEIVRALCIAGSSSAVEKLKWKWRDRMDKQIGRNLTILNSCVGIPRSALQFHDK